MVGFCDGIFPFLQAGITNEFRDFWVEVGKVDGSTMNSIMVVSGTGKFGIDLTIFKWFVRPVQGKLQRQRESLE